MVKNKGQEFQDDIKNSCDKQGIHVRRLRDVYIPPHLRDQIAVPESPYDFEIFFIGSLLSVELKSTKLKSLSFKMIKEHQITGLQKELQYEGVYPGFIFNFREYDNATYFIHISDFLIYQQVVAGEIASPYKGAVNAGSIPLHTCAEIGIQVDNQKLRVHYRYDMDKLVKDILNAGRWQK